MEEIFEFIRFESKVSGSGGSPSRESERLTKRPHEKSRSRSSSPAVVVRSAKEKTPKWAKSLLLANKSSDVRLEKLERFIKHHAYGQKKDW